MKSVQNTIRVFEVVALHQPIGLSELSRQVDIPKSTVQRTLNTLRDAGWIRHDIADPGQWVVTAHFAMLADLAPVSITVREAAQPHLELLRTETNCAVGLFLLDGSRMAIVAGMQAPSSARDIEVTFGSLPVHVSAAGRAILSRLPLATRQEVLSGELPRYTELSLVEQADVLEAVSRTEELGYCEVHGEYQPDTSAIAAPVLDRRSFPVAAVTLLCPTSTLDSKRTAMLGQRVMQCAAEIHKTLRETIETD